MTSVAERLQQAVQLHTRGELGRAGAIYQELLAIAPDQPDALHLLGVALTQTGQLAQGAALIERSLAVNPRQPIAAANLGHALLAMNRADAALAAYDRSLAMSASDPAAHNGRGSALASVGRFEDGLESFDRALQLAPGFLEARNNRGIALHKLGRLAEAIQDFDGVLAARPDDAKTLTNRAAVRQSLGRYAEALSDCDRALRAVPALLEAHELRCSALLALHRFGETLAEAELILSIKPTDTQALLTRATALRELGRRDEAREACQSALRLDPDWEEALTLLGALEMADRRYEAAAAAFERLCALAPQRDFVRGALLHARLHLFAWADYATARQRILEDFESGARPDQPLSFLALSDDPERQLLCAERRQAIVPAPPVLPPRVDPNLRVDPNPRADRTQRDRIRVAYVSADFLEHPMAYLLAGLFEQHDRARFDVIGVSLRADPASPMAQRLSRAFERFIDASRNSDEEIARLLQALDVDIAVDLMGSTAEERPAILRARPAPLQVNYIGFPGTMGAPHIDYLIADRYVIPPASARFYREQVVYLPECFQANDARRIAPAPRTERARVGLPESGFVWTSFSGSFKINPPLFDVWARLLKSVPDSVLWLIASGATAEANLRREAERRGLEPQRLVFAQRVPYPEHLARLACADLCLDTWPFNGGATTSDALWMGVPVVSCAGRAFASRMSGSLLATIGLPELVTDNFDDYESRARRLALNPGELAAVKARLLHGRAASPLFATDRFRRHVESAYSTMVERHSRGEAPASFFVSAGTSGGEVGHA